MSAKNPSPLGHPVVRIALATALFVTSFAMYAPVLAVLLQQRGHGPFAVGAFAMIGFACVAALIPFLPTLITRFDGVRVFLLDVGCGSPPDWATPFLTICGFGAALRWWAASARRRCGTPPKP